jgi:CRP-like cAMP-binding protein
MNLSQALVEVPFFREVSEADRERLTRRTELRALHRTHPIWNEDDQAQVFSFLVSGNAKLVRRSPDGRETILDLCFPGRLLCAGAVCADRRYCCHAIAMNECQVLELARRDLLQLVQRHPPLTGVFLREATCRSAGLCQRIDEVASGQIDRRLALLLLRLLDEIGQPVEQGERIPLSLSRQELAGLCGTTVETAIRLMRKFQRQGTVITEAEGFLVTDRSVLAALTHGPQRRPQED